MSHIIEFRGFLVDECCGVLASSLRFPVLTYSDVGIGRGTPDDKVLEHAHDHGVIVVTRNRSDFVHAAEKAARESSEGACKAMRCQDGIGLVTVADGLTEFHFDRVTKSLRLGPHEIIWHDVFMLNLRVHIRPDQQVAVGMLPRCERCMNDHVDECERCTTLGVLERYEEQKTAGFPLRT